MRKRYIISLDKSTDDQNKELISYIESKGMIWWHWISNTWLLVDKKGQYTASEIRSDLGEIFPSVTKMVIEIRGNENTWAGFGPNSGDKNMFEWLKQNWKG